MANSSSNIDNIKQSQSGKEVTANDYFDAASPSTLYGRRAFKCSGLTWGCYGGTALVNGIPTNVPNVEFSLIASSTNYIEAEPTTGAVLFNNTGFTAGMIPLYTVVVGPSTVTSYTDHRISARKATGLLVKAMSDTNTTLTYTEAANDILQFTGTLTSTRNIVVPIKPLQWTVFNGTTGGFGLQFIGATGTGVTVAAGKRAVIYSDGTNVVRVTVDV